MKLVALLLLALPIWPQTPTTNTPPAAQPLSIPLPAPTPITNLPSLVLTGGGGFASPSGKFAYASASYLVLPQNTYATIAQEYTLVKGQIQSSTLAGVTKPVYQFSVVTVGLTGLGGGTSSTSGSSSLIGEGQAFLHVRWGKLPLGTVLTFMKNTNSAYKVTLGFSYNK